jgi:hypothetical protein
MIGWFVLAAAVVAMYRIADVEGKSGLLWGGLTFAICIAMAFLLPNWPIVNVALGGIASFIVMFVYKIVTND